MGNSILTFSWLRNELRNWYDKYSNDLHYTEGVYVRHSEQNFVQHVKVPAIPVKKERGFVFHGSVICWVFMSKFG